MILLFISFIAGVLTILAPCVLPLLPVIVGSSVAGEASKKKAFIITSSLAGSLVLFTLLLKASTAFIAIPQSVWSWVSGGIIILFGVASLFPDLWGKIPGIAKLNQSSNQLLAAGYKKQNIWGDIIIGASLGPVFAACSPTYFVILATVLPQSFFLGLTDLFAYAFGLSLMLLLVAFLGQKIVARLGGAADPNGWFKKTLGMIFIILGIMIITGYDKKLEIGILDAGVFDITKVEQSLLQLNDTKKQQEPKQDFEQEEFVASQQEVDGSSATIAPEPATTTAPSELPPTNPKNIPASPKVVPSIIPAKPHGKKAPEIVNPSGFINTGGAPITISQFKGKKVVLLDVWTYSCINCQRTLPYVTAWHKKYKDMGLEIIGLHTPEFAFEKVQSNVEDAVRRFGIEYPVVLDNNYATWNAYGNQYWPRKYLIDINGYIVYDHIGEGGYEETEKKIQDALKERIAVLGESGTVNQTVTKEVPLEDGAKSPETYFGSARNSQQTNFLFPKESWTITPEFAQNTAPKASIIYTYTAKNVFFVSEADEESVVEVTQDGKPLGAEAGADIVKTSDGKTVVKIKEARLYKIIQGDKSETHTLKFIIQKLGVKAFTFTFG